MAVKDQDLNDQLIATMARFNAFYREMENEFERDILNVYKDSLKNTRKVSRRGQKRVKKNPGSSAAFQNDLGLIIEHPEPSSAAGKRSQRLAAKKAREKTSLQLRQTLSEKMRNPGSGEKKLGLSMSSLSKSSAISSIEEKDEKLREQKCETSPEKELCSNISSCVVVLNRCEDLISKSKSNMAVRDCNLSNNLEHSDQDIFKAPLPPKVLKVTLNDIFEYKSESKADRNRSTVDFQLSEDMLENKRDVHLTQPLALSSSFNKETESENINNVISPDKTVSLQTKKNHKIDCHQNNSEPLEPMPETGILDATYVKHQDISQSKLVEQNGANVLELPNSSRPVRIRTKNRKYIDNLLTEKVSSKNSSNSQKNIPEIIILSSENDDTSNNKRGTKRELEPEAKQNNKKKSLVDAVFVGGEIADSGERITKSASDGSNRTDTSGKDELDYIGAESLRSRTRTLAKSTVKDIIIIDSTLNDNSLKSDPQSTKSTDKITPAGELVNKPEQRMTRTRTKELSKNQADAILGVGLKNAEKENKSSRFLKIMPSVDKKHNTTPLASNNFIFSPNGKLRTPLNKLDSASKKIESATKVFLKDVSASQKKKEMMKAIAEESRRRREEREQRQHAHKLAVEREKEQKLAKLRKEKEEKERIIAENKRLKEEQIMLKKQNTEAMLKEAEERRLKEEEVKQARMKKMEEEKRRQAEERLKQAEEARKLHEMRLANQAKEKAAIKKEVEQVKINKINQKAKIESYELTPAKDERLPKIPKNENDYGLSDAESGDSTDDERQPKKKIPKWASKNARMKQALIQSYVHPDLIDHFFPFFDKITPHLITSQNCRPRASSSVWNTPDHTRLE